MDDQATRGGRFPPRCFQDMSMPRGMPAPSHRCPGPRPKQEKVAGVSPPQTAILCPQWPNAADCPPHRTIPRPVRVSEHLHGPDFSQDYTEEVGNLIGPERATDDSRRVPTDDGRGGTAPTSDHRDESLLQANHGPQGNKSPRATNHPGQQITQGDKSPRRKITRCSGECHRPVESQRSEQGPQTTRCGTGS